MAGGKATPKKDKMLKVSNGQRVKTGQILSRGLGSYKAGKNVQGLDTLFALHPGKIYFSKKKGSYNRIKTYINVLPLETKTAKK